MRVVECRGSSYCYSMVVGHAIYVALGGLDEDFSRTEILSLCLV
jgi:hypothetical protein